MPYKGIFYPPEPISNEILMASSMTHPLVTPTLAIQSSLLPAAPITTHIYTKPITSLISDNTKQQQFPSHPILLTFKFKEEREQQPLASIIMSTKPAPHTTTQIRSTNTLLLLTPRQREFICSRKQFRLHTLHYLLKTCP